MVRRVMGDSHIPNVVERLGALLQRAHFYLFRHRFERDLAEEMRFHLELKARSRRSSSSARA